MAEAIEKPTDEQRAFLSKLMLSSTFTAEEAHRTAIWLNSPRATKDKAKEIIDNALARIKARDDAKKDSTDRTQKGMAREQGQWRRVSPQTILARSFPAQREIDRRQPA